MWLLRIEGIDENIPKVCFSSKKLLESGFKYQYSLEDMFVGAVEACRGKGLIPLKHEEVKEPITEPDCKPAEKPDDVAK